MKKIKTLIPIIASALLLSACSLTGGRTNNNNNVTPTGTDTPVTPTDPDTPVEDLPNTTKATIAVDVSKSNGTTWTAQVGDFSYTNISVSKVNSAGIYGTGAQEMRFGSATKSGILSFTLNKATVIKRVALHVKGYENDATNIKVSTSANANGQTKAIGDDDVVYFDAFNNDNVESTTFTVSTASSSNNRFYLTKIEVSYKDADPIYPTAISLSGNNSINVGSTTQLTVGYTPSNTNKKTVYWSSSKTSVAKVSDTGVVTGIAGGSASITARALKADGTYVSATMSISVKGADPIYPTSISLSGTSTISVGDSTTLTVTYTPSTTNQKEVTWSSNKTSVATVDDNGKVTGVAEGSATITAKALKADSTYATATYTVTVEQKETAAWTIMIYMCGSDLEGDNGLATSDLQEIASVSNQPSDVNIIVEAGGSTHWESKYSSVISTTKLNRFHLKNKTYVKDEQIALSSMGNTSTFQSFLEWGLTAYPAEKTGVILWNHGGGQFGVCNDDKSGGVLTDNEVKDAVKNAYTKTGTSKLEWIGYDACLMQLQEIAEFNSPYFNYMVASQESESGYGWDYNTWVDDLFAKKSTETILKAIVDGFIADNGGKNATGSYYQGHYYAADQTLSFLNLNNMSAYKEAWETMAGQLKTKINSSNASSFRTNVFGKVKYFADTDYTYFSEFDAYHFLNILEANSTFNPGSTYINAVKEAFSDLVVYNVAQQEAAHDAYGLSVFFPAGTSYGQKGYCTSTYSNFTNWNAICSSYGGSFTSSYSY